MLRRITPILCALVLVGVTSALAQTEVRGVVKHIDPVTRTVYFTDGRTVRIKPGSTLVMNGQPVLFESLTPGTTVVMLPPGTPATAVTTVTQQTQLVPVPSTPPAMVSLPAPSPVNVTGTIARTDPLNQTITFQDGRIVRVEPHTMVWQQAPAISSLLPGSQVFVRDATAVGYLPAGTAAATTGQYMMGTVARVEPGNQQIILTNGAVIHMAPNASLRSGNQRMTMTQLRPGDEILFHVPNPVMVQAPGNVTVTTTPVPSSADRYVGSALPYQGYAVTRIEASDVQVMWSPQSR